MFHYHSYKVFRLQSPVLKKKKQEQRNWTNLITVLKHTETYTDTQIYRHSNTQLHTSRLRLTFILYYMSIRLANKINSREDNTLECLLIVILLKIYIKLYIWVVGLYLIPSTKGEAHWCIFGDTHRLNVHCFWWVLL